MALVDRGKHLKRVLFPRCVAGLPEIFSQTGSVETQIVAIGAQESGPVGDAGQILQTPFLDGQKVGVADAQIARDIRQAPAQQDPGLAQLRPHFDGIVPVREGVAARRARGSVDRPGLPRAHGATRRGSLFYRWPSKP